MTVELTFEGGVSAARVDQAILPPGGGVGVSVSADSPDLDRHDLALEKTGRRISVRVDGVSVADLSDATKQSIIDAVPATHIQTRDVQ